MSEIRIGPRSQVIGAVALLGGVAALVVVQLPEIRRYLAMRSM